MNNTELTSLLETQQATIVDVRTPSEFARGHVDNSINIPLHEMADRLEEFKKMKNLVLCCASGNRSNTATSYLKTKGIECYDGGSWLDIKNFYNN